MRCTALYLVFNDWSESNYKIGISSCPSRRLGEIAINYEVDPRVITQAWFSNERTAQIAETRWHRYFSDFRTDDHKGDEWFALPTKERQVLQAWSSTSLPFSRIFDFAFQSSLCTIRNYDKSLLNSIPRRYAPPSIDVWTMKDEIQRRSLTHR